MRWRSFLWSTLVCGALSAQATVVRDVTVLPMDRDVALEHQDVLVFDGRIRAIGEHGSLELPEGVSTVDGAGRWLMPGLCDAHVHLTDRAELLLYVAHGVTTVRNMWGGPDTLALRERIDRREVLGPTIFTTGPIADGPDPRWPGSAVLADADSASRFVDAQADAGYDAIKVYDGLGVEPYFALVARAEERRIPVVGHVPSAVGVRGAIASGQRSMEHLRGWDEIADDAIPRVAAMCAEAGVWNVPTLVVLDLPWVALRDLAAARAAPELRLVPPSIRARWDPSTDARFGGVSSVDDELWAAHLERMARARRIVKALHDAGAPMALGTDAPNPFVVPGWSVHQELEELCAAGLDAFAALKLATVDAARLLGRADAGTVAVGDVADLLLLDRDPRADIRAPRDFEAVCVHGRWLDSAEIDRRLAELVAGYDSPTEWYAGMPPMEEAGRLSFEVTWNAEPIGAERVRRTASPDGAEEWVGQWSYREGFVEERCSFVLSRRAGAQELVVDARNGEGVGRVRVTLGGGSVRAEGRTPFGQDLDVREEAAADEQLGPGILPHACVFAPRLAALDIGGATELVLRTAEIAEAFELPVTRVRSERDADGSRVLGGRRVPVRVFRLELSTGPWRTRGTLTTSIDDGLPVTIELVFPQGHKVFRRLP